MIKPSELSEHTARALAELLPRYLDFNAFAVVNGAVAETTQLLEKRWDHILYTGNGMVGRIVAAAAAKHLTPITLELGGKSPAIVDSTASLRNAARRIAWGRFANCGQTCVAPDYVLCAPGVRDVLVAEMRAALAEFYGDDPSRSDSYCRIVNERHFDRVSKMLGNAGDRARVVIGGQSRREDLYIAPTVVVDVDEASELMTDEIFGPLLPVLEVQDVDEAIDFVNARDKPLALYVFSNDASAAERVMAATSSGAVVVNDTLVHGGLATLPFGGVGESGMGGYHGRHSFETFSHLKPTLVRSSGMEFINSVRYPPYTDRKVGIMKYLLYKAPPGPYARLFRYSALAAAAGIAAYVGRAQGLF